MGGRRTKLLFFFRERGRHTSIYTSRQINWLLLISVLLQLKCFHNLTYIISNLLGYFLNQPQDSTAHSELQKLSWEVIQPHAK